MRTRFASLLASGLVASALGCGGSTESGAPGPTAPTGPTIAELPAKLAAAECAAASACFGPLFSTFLGGADCESRILRQIENSDFARWQSSVDAGKAVYHPENAQGCIDWFANGGCTALTTRDADACVSTFDGAVASGGACTYSFECAGKSFCKADATCPGTCAARLSAGQPCKVDDDCADGLSCTSDTKVCTRQATTNEACKGPAAPDCAPGLVCYGNDEQKQTAGTCKAQSEVFVGKEGDSCSFDGNAGPLCATSLSCAFSKIDQQGLHATCVKTVGSGEKCNGAIPSMCPAGEYCDVPPLGQGGGPPKLDGTCTALPGDGQPCAKAFVALQTCAPETTCDEGGTCRAIAANGGSCASDDQCWSGSCQSGTCAPRQACSP